MLNYVVMDFDHLHIVFQFLIPGPVFTNILILRKRIFLRIRKFSYLRIFLFLEKNCIHKAILS